MSQPSPDPRDGSAKRRPARRQRRHVALSSGDALRSLREHIQAAADSLRSLRQENARLRARVRELEERLPEGDVAFVVGETPDALREQIDRFIERLDAHLEGETPLGGADESNAGGQR